MFKQYKRIGWRSLLQNAPKVFWLGLLCVAALIAKVFFDYEPTNVIEIKSRSWDRNYVLELEDKEPVVFRELFGPEARSRAIRFRKILPKLEMVGVGPGLIKFDDTHLAMTHIPGTNLRLSALRDGRVIPDLIHSMDKFYKSLQSIRDEFPLFRMVDVGRKLLHAIPGPNDAFVKLIDKWEKKYLPMLEKMRMVVVHGDLHVGNILWYDKKAWLIDYDFSGRGYIVEDIARLSIYSALTKKDEQALLSHWFGGTCGGNDEELQELFEACKVFARFLWALPVAYNIPRNVVRRAVYAENPEPMDAVWASDLTSSPNEPSVEDAYKFLAASIDQMNQLFESQKVCSRG